MLALPWLHESSVVQRRRQGGKILAPISTVYVGRRRIPIPGGGFDPQMSLLRWPTTDYIPIRCTRSRCFASPPSIPWRISVDTNLTRHQLGRDRGSERLDCQRKRQYVRATRHQWPILKPLFHIDFNRMLEQSHEAAAQRSCPSGTAQSYARCWTATSRFRAFEWAALPRREICRQGWGMGGRRSGRGFLIVAIRGLPPLHAQLAPQPVSDIRNSTLRTRDERGKKDSLTGGMARVPGFNIHETAPAGIEPGLLLQVSCGTCISKQ
ncbi:hypothetical protein P171DRAFT_500888 [Karstenula rhodostoma CBS 690.94]|uniref:Uncharacterized protein n=1 Tax=Karstenula rhodostoma CBS 690.94 TaxID=1392251 RepID=A0A9P4U7M7_9PLEO|nr:hypothetical protein P171DRAFT_500888 [Karstenula rhodostoma CBS 690.94]